MSPGGIGQYGPDETPADLTDAYTAGEITLTELERRMPEALRLSPEPAPRRYGPDPLLLLFAIPFAAGVATLLTWWLT